jgi:hypothetical protein
MPDNTDVALARLTDQQLRARIRTAKIYLGSARNEVARRHKFLISARTTALTKESELRLLKLEQQRRSDEATAKAHVWMEEQSNFEKQLQAIASAILHYFPDEFSQNENSIPKAARAIIERCALKDSPRAMPSTNPQHPGEPKQ